MKNNDGIHFSQLRNIENMKLHEIFIFHMIFFFCADAEHAKIAVEHGAGKRNRYAIALVKTFSFYFF